MLLYAMITKAENVVELCLFPGEDARGIYGNLVSIQNDFLQEVPDMYVGDSRCGAIWKVTAVRVEDGTWTGVLRCGVTGKKLLDEITEGSTPEVALEAVVDMLYDSLIDDTGPLKMIVKTGLEGEEEISYGIIVGSQYAAEAYETDYEERQDFLGRENKTIFPKKITSLAAGYYGVANMQPNCIHLFCGVTGVPIVYVECEEGAPISANIQGVYDLVKAYILLGLDFKELMQMAANDEVQGEELTFSKTIFGGPMFEGNFGGGGTKH